LEEEEETSSFDQISIGLAVFKPGVSRKNIETVLYKKKKQLLQKTVWTFQNLNLDPQRQKKFFHTIKELQIIELDFSDTSTC